MSFQGIDIRQTGDRLVFRSLQLDATGTAVGTGSFVVLRLYELQSDGSLKSYDYSTNTFKTTAVTSEVVLMTARTGNNSTFNTALYTYSLTTLTGFTAGNIYIAHTTNYSAFPTYQAREFQFGVASTFDPFNPNVLLSTGTGSGQLDFTNGVVKSNLVQTNSVATPSLAGMPAVINVRSRRKIFVSKSGNNSNDGFSEFTPKLTIAGAGSIMQSGDHLQVFPGTYNELVDFSALGLNLRNILMEGTARGTGSGTSGVNITATPIGNFFGVVMGNDDCTFRGLNISVLYSGTGIPVGTGLTFLNANNGTIENCDITGYWDCVLNGKINPTDPSVYGFTARNCKLTSHGDVLNLAGNIGFLIDSCVLFTDSTNLALGVVGGEPTNGIICPTGGIGVINKSSITVNRDSSYNNTSYKSAGINCGGPGSHITVLDTPITINATGATDGGDLRGIGPHYASPDEVHAAIVRSEIIINKVNAAQNGYLIDASVNKSRVFYSGITLDRTKFNGPTNVTSDIHYGTGAVQFAPQYGNAPVVSGTGSNQINLVNGNVALQSNQVVTTGTNPVASVTNPVITGTNNDKTGYSITSAEELAIAYKVWEELLNGTNHTGTGKAGQVLEAAATSTTLAAVISQLLQIQTTGTDTNTKVSKVDTTLQPVGTGYQFTGTALANAPTGTGGSSGTSSTVISPSRWDKENEWRFDNEDQLTAVNQIRQIVGFKGLLAMNFDEILPKDDTLFTASIVLVSPSSGLTIQQPTSLYFSPGLRKILINVTASTIAGTYVVVIQGSTIDSQTFLRRGILVLETPTGT